MIRSILILFFVLAYKTRANREREAPREVDPTEVPSNESPRTAEPPKMCGACANSTTLSCLGTTSECACSDGTDSNTSCVYQDCCESVSYCCSSPFGIQYTCQSGGACLCDDGRSCLDSFTCCPGYPMSTRRLSETSDRTYRVEHQDTLKEFVKL